jgi:cyanuric acid amidohydrolase
VFANSYDEKDADKADADKQDARLELYVTRTRDFKPEEVGTPEMIQETRRAIQEYMGGLDKMEEIFVQIKCPRLTPERVAEAAARGQTCATTDSYKSMALSRGASTIGAALAIETLRGSLPPTYTTLAFTDICKNYAFYSDRVSSSAGVELMHCEILVLVRTNRRAFDAIPGIIRNPNKSKFQMACGRMDDAIDLAGVMKCVDEARGPSGTNEIVTAIVKADPAASVRGRRTTMLSDSDINATRHSRAAVGGVVAAAVGGCRVYVSGGAEHQGPDGGGPVCVISRVRTPGSEEGTKRKR